MQLLLTLGTDIVLGVGDEIVQLVVEINWRFQRLLDLHLYGTLPALAQHLDAAFDATIV